MNGDTLASIITLLGLLGFLISFVSDSWWRYAALCMSLFCFMGLRDMTVRLRDIEVTHHAGYLTEDSDHYAKDGDHGVFFDHKGIEPGYYRSIATHYVYVNFYYFPPKLVYFKQIKPCCEPCNRVAKTAVIAYNGAE